MGENLEKDSGRKTLDVKENAGRGGWDEYMMPFRTLRTRGIGSECWGCPEGKKSVPDERVGIGEKRRKVPQNSS